MLMPTPGYEPPRDDDPEEDGLTWTRIVIAYFVAIAVASLLWLAFHGVFTLLMDLLR